MDWKFVLGAVIAAVILISIVPVLDGHLITEDTIAKLPTARKISEPQKVSTSSIFGAKALNVINVTSCMDLTASDTIYVISQNLTGLVPGQGYCLKVTGSNVVIDCNGYKILGSNSGYGIYFYTGSNATVKNCAIEKYAYGIYTIAYTHVTVEDSNFLSNTYAIYARSHYLSVFRSNFSSNSNGVMTFYANYNDVVNNSFAKNKYDALIIHHSNYNNVINNHISNGGHGIYLVSSNNDVIMGNMITSNINYGLYLSSSNDNEIVNNTLRDNSYGVFSQSSTGNQFEDNNIYGNNWYDFKLTSGSTAELTNNYISKGVELSSSEISVENTDIGGSVASFTSRDVKVSPPTSIPSTPSNYISTGDYLLAANTSSGGWLVLNMSYSDSDVYTINESTLRMWKYNGSWYELPNSTVDISNNVVYGGNITSFSTFALLGLPNEVNSCMNLTEPNKLYVLNASINGTQPGRDVCIDVQADNVVLDCDGYSIDGSSVANLFYGIRIRGHNNFTLRNCNISNYQRSVLLYNGSDFLVENNIFSNVDVGVDSTFGFNIAIKNNSFMDINNRAIDVTSTENLTVEGNHIYSADTGVFISQQNAHNFTIRNNVINYTSTGLKVYYAEGVLIDNNTIVNTGMAMELLHTKHTRVYDNYVKNMTDYGIFVRTTPFQGSFNLTFVNNTILDVGATGTPIYLENLGDVSVANSTISGGFNTGMFVFSCKGINISLVDISDIVGYGIYIERGHDALVTNLSRSNVSNEFVYITNSKDIELSNLDLSGGISIYSIDSERVSVHDSTFNDSRVRFSNTPSFELYNSNLTNGLYGVEVYTSDNGAISNNMFYNDEYGVYILNANDTIVENNSISLGRAAVRIQGGTRNIIRGNTITNNTAWGVSIYTSNLNEIYSNVFRNNFQDIYLSGRFNNVHDNLLSGFDLLSIYPYGDDNSIVNNTIFGNGSGYGVNIIGDRNLVYGGDISNCGAGIRIVGSLCENNTIESAYIHGNDYGIYLINYAKGTIVEDSNITDNNLYDIYVEHDTNITLVNVTTNNTLYSLRGNGIFLRAAVPQEEVDDDYVDLHKYLMITNASSSSWVELNISYTDDEIRQYNIDESTIRLWRFNGTWQPPEKAAEVNVVNTEENYVYSKINMFSIFTLVGKKVETTTPSVSISSIEPPLVCADDVAYYYFHRVYPDETKEAEKTFCNDLRVSSITTDGDVFQAKIIVENMESTTKVPNIPYKYFKVRVINPEGIDKVEFELRVNKTWISENGIAPTTVKLYYYDNGWNELNTKLVYDDEDYYYYKAEASTIANLAASGSVGVDFWNVFESIQKYYLNEVEFSDVINTISLYYSSNQ
ncbi:MAG: right-handed parallel beta-helix repeat-containing protein [Nanoarchaeota archaeon]|nr:right-handed parallel beta-helix repeat-containing protein [Nanoarchaeota archaeon]